MISKIATKISSNSDNDPKIDYKVNQNKIDLKISFPLFIDRGISIKFLDSEWERCKNSAYDIALDIESQVNLIIGSSEEEALANITKEEFYIVPIADGLSFVFNFEISSRVDLDIPEVENLIVNFPR